MAKQTINIGTVANDHTGDTVRSAFDKTNQNFTELYLKNNFYTVTTIAALQTYLSGITTGDINVFVPYGTYSVTAPITASTTGVVRIFSEGATFTNNLPTLNQSVFQISSGGVEMQFFNIDMKVNTTAGTTSG